MNGPTICNLTIRSCMLSRGFRYLIPAPLQAIIPYLKIAFANEM